MHLLKAKITKYLLFACLPFFLWQCNTTKKLPLSKTQQLAQMVHESPVFTKGFTGFLLYDPASSDTLLAQHADKYFTPASNTKVFTFFTALKVLGDQLPAAHYQLQGDSLIFWGTGNPLLLHPEFEQSDTLLHFLRKHKDKQLFFSTHNYQDDRFGSGWMWDDYSGGYQAEKSSLPIYGNLATIQTDSNRTISIEPACFGGQLRLSANLTSAYPRSTRAEISNDFVYNQQAHQKAGYKRRVPFRVTPDVICRILQMELHRPVELIDWQPGTNTMTIMQALPDTLYRKLMLPSNNFVAEQLLLMASDRLFDTLNTRKVIAYAKNTLLTNAPDELQWIDASGLSRYNKFTPRTMVYVFEQLYRAVPQERLFGLLATGGVSGTIRRWYGGEEPYIFAKTGTVRHVHCLSGFIKTDRGRVLIFSFMHNNFTIPIARLKEEMEHVLEFIKKEY